jgi:hypothetical protein
VAAGPGDPQDPPPLVFVQSIGHPVPGPDGWQAAADTIGKLGGTSLAFLNLHGDSGYSLVGSEAAGSLAAEGGSILGEASPLGGVLTPTHDFTYLPLTSGPASAADPEKILVEYQAPVAWPAINQKAQERIGADVGLCPAGGPCNIRKLFISEYLNEKWPTFETRVHDLPDSSGPGFTDGEFHQTRVELDKEIDWFLDVRGYFHQMAVALGNAGSDHRVNVTALGQAVYDAVKPPPANTSTSFLLGLIGNIVKLGGFAGGKYSAVASGLGAVFGLAAYLTGKSGDTSQASAVKVRADQLAQLASASVQDAANNFETEGMIVVSDYGKLKLAGIATSPATRTWQVPQSSADFIPQLKLAVQRWFMESLVPAAYPWRIRGTPPNDGLGTTTANDLVCDILGQFGQRTFARPWFSMPANAQFRAIQGWGRDGQAFLPTFFFTRSNVVMTEDRDPERVNSIPQSLADTLFGHREDDLGLNLYEFISQRYFGDLHNANNRAQSCGLKG